MKHYGLILGMVLVLLLSGCQQATDHGSSPGSTSGPVQGTIHGQGFTTTVAVATVSKTASNSYDIVLNGSSPAPYVYFTIGSSVKSYAVTTFGINGLGVYAFVGGSNFVSFDGGTLEITKVDVGAKQISGLLVAVKTSDGKSSLTGTFTAPIQ